ncbi:HAD family hydrolase [Streptomyces sp. NPDC096136]|uniref:HAD family hydrolase n=1 Tax=Streptomyces sp. NPDC096136 TaxID=3366076 RepID=UPI0037F64FD2
MSANATTPNATKPSAAGVRIAALDVDGTLVDGTLGWALPHNLVADKVVTTDRLRPFLTYLDRVGRENLEHPPVAARAWQIYATVMTGVSASAATAVAHRTWLEKRADIHPFAPALVSLLRQSGFEPVLVSVGPHDLVGHIARHLGISRYTGTVMAQHQGTYTGTLASAPLRDKPAAVTATALPHRIDWTGSLALGNSLLDLELLQHAGTPLAFEPSPALHTHAARHTWTITDRHTILDVIDRYLTPAARKQHGHGEGQISRPE